MIDYYACIKLKYPNIPDTAFSLISINDSVTISYWDSTYGQQPTIAELEAYHIADLRKKALAEIKELRRVGLDKAALSPGILAIYESNYEAAVVYKAGNSSVLLKNGMEAEAYLLGFGSKLGMTASQFADYIIAENRRVGPTVYDVERLYLSLTYAGCQERNILPIAALTTEEQINAAVEMFKTFCCT